MNTVTLFSIHDIRIGPGFLDVRVGLNLRDMWVGVFWKPRSPLTKTLTVYVCLLPCVPIRFMWCNPFEKTP